MQKQEQKDVLQGNFVLRMISWLGTGQKKYIEVVNVTVMYRKEN